MATLDLLERLRTALAAVPGYHALPENTFPTLPILEATEFGQQHLITTFSVGPPPASALDPSDTLLPALSLHVILPEGYTYWQPETGTGQHLPPVLEVAQLPARYQTLLQQRTAELAAHSGEGFPPAQLSHYLLLLGQLAEEGWLLSEAPASPDEKPLALRLQQDLAQLAAPELDAYYRTRGRALYAWMARVTYEKNWVERALDAMWDAAPDWLRAGREEDSAVEAMPVVPAVLDARQCLAISFCHVFQNTGNTEALVSLPFGECYISYPDMEILWRPLVAENHVGLLSAPRDESGRPFLGTKPVASDAAAADGVAVSYRQWVSVLLKQRWLLTRYTVTEEEEAAARALQECVALLYGPLLSARFQHHAWQLLGWMRRTTGGV